MHEADVEKQIIELQVLVGDKKRLIDMYSNRCDLLKMNVGDRVSIIDAMDKMWEHIMYLYSQLPSNSSSG